MPDLEARVVFKAIKGIHTVQQITAENKLHPTQVTQWDTHMIEGAAEESDTTFCNFLEL